MTRAAKKTKVTAEDREPASYRQAKPRHRQQYVFLNPDAAFAPNPGAVGYQARPVPGSDPHVRGIGPQLRPGEAAPIRANASI
jgi:hypothetical protein